MTEDHGETDLLEQVSSFCDAYSRELSRRQSHEPSLTPLLDYLEQIQGNVQSVALRNLLHIELDHRENRGERPKLEEYFDRLPSEYGSLIRQVFAERLDRVPSTCNFIPGQMGLRRIGAYEILGRLGKGGMGIVFHARHVQRGDEVALKTIRDELIGDGQHLRHFKREFRSLADINHPNLIALHELESDGGQWYFTMDLVHGSNFLEYVRPNDCLDTERLKSATVPLVRGAMALHSHHIVHQDLKPSNVMVNTDGNVIILDFGLVLEIDDSGISGRTENTGGTPEYMAPEQAAQLAINLMSGELSPITGASDWYAVGVMLHQAITGTLPFPGRKQSLFDKQQKDPPRIQNAAHVPAELCELTTQLLARNPNDRPGALEIVEALSDVASLEDLSRLETKEVLIGRGRQLKALRSALGNVQQSGKPTAAFVTGRSGEGKTSLLRHFLKEHENESAVIPLGGRCYDRESVPFKALDVVIDSLCSHLRSVPIVEVAILVPDDIGMLSHLFPVLNSVEAISSKSKLVKKDQLSEQQIRTRAFLALRELMKRIAVNAVVICYIDDLQWGDADSATAIAEIFKPHDAPRLLFIGTYRSDEAATSPFLESWRNHQRQQAITPALEVNVGPLTESQCKQLAAEILGCSEESVLARVLEFYRQTGGNPMLFVELIGCFDPEKDSFVRRDIHHVIESKLTQLPSESRKLLEAVAVSGQAILLDELSQAAGLLASPNSTLHRMQASRLVRGVGTREVQKIDTYHDRVRESVLRRLPDNRKTELHGRLADVVADQFMVDVEILTAALCDSGADRSDELNAAGNRIYDLAFHSREAGRSPDNWVFSLLAAEQAKRQFALDTAEELFQAAEESAADCPGQVRFRILYGLGEVLALQDKYERAIVVLEQACTHASDTIQHAQIEALTAEVLYKQRHVLESINTFEAALRRLGYWVPRSGFGLICGIIREVAVQCFHSLAPPSWYSSDQSPSAELLLSTRLQARLVYPYYFRSALRFAWAHLGALNRTEIFPVSAVRAFVYAIHGSGLMAIIGWHSRADRYAEKALEICRLLEDKWGEAHATHFRGMEYWANCRFGDAVRTLQRSIELFKTTGDKWEMGFAYVFKANALYRWGKLKEARQEAQAAFESAVLHGQDTIAQAAVDILTRASGGDVDFEDLTRRFKANKEDFMSTIQLYQAEGLWHRFHGRTQDSVECFETAVSILRKNLTFNFLTAPAIPGLAMLLREQAEEVSRDDASGARRLLRRALRVARWARWLTSFVPHFEIPRSLREMALSYAGLGKTRQALHYAQESCKVAERHDAMFELVKSRLALGQIMRSADDPYAATVIAQAESELSELDL